MGCHSLLVVVMEVVVEGDGRIGDGNDGDLGDGGTR